MGARVSLSIGFVAALINAVVGTVLGGFCGYYGGKLDMIVMRIIDIIYGIPSLIVCILVMVVLGAGIQSLIIAMVIVGWTGTCRFTRGEVYRLKEQEFVLAARVMGCLLYTSQGAFRGRRLRGSIFRFGALCLRSGSGFGRGHGLTAA